MFNSAGAAGGIGIPVLIDNLSEAAIRLNLKSGTKEEILSELVGVLVENGTIASARPLLEALLEREALGSTGIGCGVAVPHSRCKELTRPAVILGRTEREVEFGAIDGQPARLFFLLVAPENRDNEHLHLLAEIARLMKDPAIREALLRLETPGEVAALIGEKEAR